MSLRRYFSSALIAALTIFSIGTSAKMTCKNQWGVATVLPKTKCKVEFPTDPEPVSIYINGVTWKPRREALSFKIKMDDTRYMGGFKLTFYRKKKPIAFWTLPLYGDPLYNIFQDGLSTWLSIPYSDLEWAGKKLDIKKAYFDQITMYVATVGKDGKAIIDIEKVKKEKKPKLGKVSITFDDGYIGNYRAAKMMAPLKLSGTAYVIPQVVNKPGYLNEKQLQEMKDWGWSLSTHLDPPVTKIVDLDRYITESKNMMSKWGTEETISQFALPLGKYNAKSMNILKKYFKSIRLAGGMTQPLPVKDKSRLKTINVINSMSPKEVYDLCMKAVNNGEWAILMFHYMDQPAKGQLNYSSNNFKKLVEMLSKHKEVVLPVDKVI